MLSESQFDLLHYHKHEKDYKNGISCPKFRRHVMFFSAIKKAHQEETKKKTVVSRIAVSQTKNIYSPYQDFCSKQR